MGLLINRMMAAASMFGVVRVLPWTAQQKASRLPERGRQQASLFQNHCC
ncbi:hypothetical protein [Dankookia sp. GCM10030260]